MACAGPVSTPPDAAQASFNAATVAPTPSSPGETGTASAGPPSTDALPTALQPPASPPPASQQATHTAPPGQTPKPTPRPTKAPTPTCNGICVATADPIPSSGPWAIQVTTTTPVAAGTQAVFH